MFFRNGPHKSIYLYGLVFLVLSINQQLSPILNTFQFDQWSTPQTIPLYHPETWPPILIADQNRTVHAISSQWIDNGSGTYVREIVYNQWTLQNGWTIPVDIVLSPVKEARLTDAFLDKEGMLHVVFFGGDNTSANIYYSKAPAVDAATAGAWSYPIIIGENAGDPENAVFAENDQGTLYVVYSGRELGNGLYKVSSTDRGDTWSDSTPIFFNLSGEPNIFLLRIIKGESGWLHAIWSVYDATAQGRGIYYTRSSDGNKWSEPVLLADAQEGLGTQTPTIIEYDGKLIALYNMTPKIMMRSSSDDGETWDTPTAIFPRHIGVNGALSLVIDSNDELHLFFGQRISGSPDIHGMWHSTFINNRWTEPEALIKGPKVSDLVGSNSFDPNTAHAVVSQGNVILVTWRTDPGARGNGVWYSYKTGFGPELPVEPLPTMTSDINQNAGLEATPNTDSSPLYPSPTHVNLNTVQLENSPFVLSSGAAIAITFIVVAIFVGLLLILILNKRSS